MTPPTDFKDVVNIFLGIINPLLLLLAGLSLLVFFRGVAVFIFNADDAKMVEEGRELMKWGLIALFVMVSVWGILAVLNDSFFAAGTLGFPTLPTSH